MITSAQNSKVQLTRKLINSRKDREQNQCYVVEGVRLVEEAARTAKDCRFALFSEPASERTRTILKSFTDAGVETEEIKADLMSSISDTGTPQGLLAVMNRCVTALPEAPNFIVIADGIHDPGNLGTLFRTASAAKADALLLMPGCADEYSPKVLRSGMGAHFNLPFIHMDWDRVEIYLSANPKIQCLAADSDGGISCWKTDLTRPTALIIGSEADGPCEEALRLSDARVLIPMPGTAESLNAGVAAGILIFEVVRQRAG